MMHFYRSLQVKSGTILAIFMSAIPSWQYHSSEGKKRDEGRGPKIYCASLILTQLL